MTRYIVLFLAVLLLGWLFVGEGAEAQDYSSTPPAGSTTTSSGPMQIGMLTDIPDKGTIEINWDQWVSVSPYVVVVDQDGKERKFSELAPTTEIKYRVTQGLVDRIEATFPTMRR